MQLLYVYLEDYQVLKDVGFNFGGSPFQFNYDFRTNELEVKDSIFFVENFFQSNEHKKKSLVNISAIIGKNGTGKTSLLNFIKTNLLAGSKLQYKGIYIFKLNGSYKTSKSNSPVSNKSKTTVCLQTKVDLVLQS